MFPRLSTLPRSARVLLRLVLMRFREDRCLQVAGELTFTTLLALVPLLTIAFALFAAFPVFDDWSNAFKVFLLTTLVPEMGGKIITVYMQQFADNAAKLTVIGLVFLALTALALMLTIERVFNVIWRVPRPRPIAQRLIIYWATLTLGPILLGASLSLTSWLVTQSMSMTADTKDLHTFLLKTVPILLNVAAFGLLYFLIPNRRIALTDALIGGAVAAVAFEVMKRLFALYIQLVPTYSLIYGAFATLPIFLLWIHLSWVVILFGAVVVAVLPRWRLGMLEHEEPPGKQLFRALGLIESLAKQQALAQAPGTARLATLCRISEEETEQLLERMHGLGWVRRVDSGGWILGRDLATLRVGDFYRVFVMAAQSAEPHGVLGREADRLMRDVDDRLDVSLRSLIESDPVAADQRAANPQGQSRPGAS